MLIAVMAVGAAIQVAGIVVALLWPPNLVTAGVLVLFGYATFAVAQRRWQRSRGLRP